MEQRPDGSAAVDEQMKQHNRLIIAEIDARIANGLSASLKPGDYYVIRNRSTGVLSVLASSAVDDDKAIIFGPDRFERCIQQVNQSLLARLAETDGLEAHQHNQKESKK